MNKLEYMEEGEKNLLHTYNRFKVVLDRGEGVHLYDIEGNEYLDFASGIAVFALGYNNEEYNKAVTDQLNKLIHTSNLFYNVPAIEASKKILDETGLKKVFFTNSGTEAVEGAIKIARKYAYNKDGKNDHEIIAMNHSFHGRSMGALSVTGNEAYQKAFRPLIGGVKFAEYNDLKSVEALVNEKTCGIILETVQGEGGIYPAKEEFIRGIKKICDEKDILLILDEIQCGMGRTGEMFAYKKYNILPDVLTSAKALGCGVPVGAFITGEKVSEVLVPGDHGTTYGGNPLVCAAVSKVFDIFHEKDVLSNVKEMGEYLSKKLDDIVLNYNLAVERRGVGLMQGIEFDSQFPVGNIISKAMEKGLIIISAGGNVIRFVPPLVITKEDIDSMIVILKEVLDSLVK